MARTRLSGFAFAVLVVWVAGCSVDLQLPEGAQVTCQSASECPGDTVCHAGHCVKGEQIGTPPDLVGLPVVSPLVGKAGTEFTIDLEATKPLVVPPTVRLGLVPPVEITCAAAGGERYRCTYLASGDENGGLGGVVGFDLSLTDQVRTTTVRNLVGALHLDFAAPVLRLATAAYLPDPTNPLPTVSRGTAGTVVVVTIAADEPLDVATPPALEARSGGTTLPFSLVPGSLDANGAAFEATVPAGLPDGEYALHVTWSDPVGNVDDADVASPSIRIKTSLPTLAVDQAAVTFVRAPWGVADVGATITSPAVPAGQVFAALAPADPTAAATHLATETFTAPGGISILRIWKDAARTSQLVGRVVPEPGGWPRILVPGGEDLPAIWVSAVDDAGNESSPVRLRNAEWIATPGRPVVGTSPHEVHSTYYAPDTLVLGRSVSEPRPAEAPRLDLVQQAHSALRSRFPERKLGPPARSDFGAAFDVARGVMVLHGGISPGGEAFEDTWEWDGTSWTEVVSASGFVPGPTPPPLMTYDGARGRVVLEDSDYSIWEWDGDAWSRRSRSAPNWRGFMAFDSAREQVVVVPNGYPYIPDTHEWDGYGWLDVPGASPPGPRIRGAMAYDAHRGVMVFYGGRDAYVPDGVQGDLWERHGTEWRVVAQAGAAPGPRHGHALVYDSAARRMLLVGGADQDGVLHSDVRAWDGTTWSDVTPPGPAPAPRRDAAVVFDPGRERLVLHGGLGSGDAVLDDTWELAEGGWEDLSVTRLTPPPRHSHAMAYDPVREVVVLHGGSGGTGWLFGEDGVWEYDGRWRYVPPPAGQPGPGQRAGHGMAFHSASGRLLILGGSGPYGSPDDVWEWNGTGWIDRTPTGSSPGQREGFALSDDPSRGVLRLTGGRVYQSGWFDRTDHWELSAAGDRMAWLERSASLPAGLPRSEHAQLFDGARTLVMCGNNQSSGFLEDAWAFDGTSWAQVVPDGPGSTLSRGPGVWDPVRRRGVLLGDPYVEVDPYRLEWLGDGLRVIGPTSTDRWPLFNRNATAIAYDSRRNRTVVFGGFKRPASLAMGDTWEVDADLDAQGLQLRSPAVQFTVRYGGAGFDLSRVLGLRVRARAGGDFSPLGAGARLLGWHRDGPDRPGGGWMPLAENTDGVPLPASPAGLLDWTAPASELQRFFRERDSALAFRLRPAGAPPADADESVVHAEYLEVRIRYTTDP